MYEITVQPTVPAVTLAQAKNQLRYGGNDRDADIEGIVLRATRHVENFVGIRLMRATVVEYLDAFPYGNRGLIELSVGPVAEVTGITYVSTAGIPQSVDAEDFQVDTVSHPARLAPAYGRSWPSARRQFNAVAITYLVGVENRALLPAAAVQAILLLVEHWFDQPEESDHLSADMTGSLRALLMDLKGDPHA